MRIAAFAALFVTLLVGSSEATELWFMEVAQPLNNGNTVQVCRVTYGRFFGSLRPGEEILHTCDTNLVVIEAQAPRGESVNAAREWGLSISLEGINRDKAWVRKDTVDTATVVLSTTKAMARLAGMIRKEPDTDEWANNQLDATVKATVKAIRLNAEVSVPHIRYLRLMIQGTRRYKALERIYKIAARDVPQYSS